MASPQKTPHAYGQSDVVRWLMAYEDDTAGTGMLFNTTDILGEYSQPEPDACLYILPEHGGQVWEDENQYLNGSPDLVAEVSWSSESIDLNRKKADYEEAGVREYIVVALRQNRVFWFIRRRGRFKELQPDPDGIYRSEVFPGLWLDPAALLRRDRKKLLAVLRQGLATPQHGAFVAKLAAKRGR